MSQETFTAMLILLVPCIVELIAKNYEITEIVAARLFYSSMVYAVLEDERTKLWHFSPLTLYNMFDNEQKTGEIHFPEEV